MKLLFLMVLLVGCATDKNQHLNREPAQTRNIDPTLNMIRGFQQNSFANQMQQQAPRQCYGNPPGQDDAWCSYVCIDGRWSRVCR